MERPTRAASATTRSLAEPSSAAICSRAAARSRAERFRFSAASKSASTRAAAIAALALHDALALARQRDAALIRLPAEIGVRNRARQHQRGGAAIRLRRMRLVHGRFHRVALLAPPIEGVARLQSEVGLVVPGEAEQLRREQAVVAQALTVDVGIGIDARPGRRARDAHRLARRIVAGMRGGQGRRGGQRRARSTDPAWDPGSASTIPAPATRRRPPPPSPQAAPRACSCTGACFGGSPAQPAPSSSSAKAAKCSALHSARSDAILVRLGEIASPRRLSCSIIWRCSASGKVCIDARAAARTSWAAAGAPAPRPAR